MLKINGQTFRKVTPKEVEYVKANYSDTSNDDILKNVGFKDATLDRLANALGLKKSDEYMANLRRRCLNRALSVLRATNGWTVQNLKRHKFPKGFNLRETVGEERFNEIREAISKTLIEKYKAERRRVMFGLPQQTKYRVVRSPERKQKLRYRLRKAGYTEVEYCLFVVPEKRNLRMEQKASDEFKIKFIEKE